MHVKCMGWVFGVSSALAAFGGCALVAGLGDEYTTATDFDGSTSDGGPAEGSAADAPAPDGFALDVTPINAASNAFDLPHARTVQANVKLTRGADFRQAVDVTVTVPTGFLLPAPTLHFD
ncbi:MAG: hypothetical protein JWM74_858, partial [Myxococcaceae bacterium]|nr:hypothetical protein [Myxococcaceae bacterium]